uniref:hypothetical protein n=1 Tax=uncultured Draconibacterium sp. TaxID=1573823 RepID=UPI0032176289
MNAKQKLLLGLLIFGFILSSIIRVRFNLSDGFEFHNFWITPIPSIFDFAALSSSELELTTTILGYLSFLIAGILMLRIVRSSANNKDLSVIAFLVVTCFAIIFEFSSVIQDLNSSFGGKHLRMGLILFVISLTLLFKSHRELKLKNKP